MCNARRSYFVGHIELKNKNKFNLEDKITIKKFEYTKYLQRRYRKGGFEINEEMRIVLSIFSFFSMLKLCRIK